MDQAIVIRPRFAPGRRIIAVSDVHGNLDFFRGLMDRVGLTPSDILVLVGDLLEKGPDSLALLRYVMELSRTHTVYPLCGNCDGLVLRFFETDELDERFFMKFFRGCYVPYLDALNLDLELRDELDKTGETAYNAK